MVTEQQQPGLRIVGLSGGIGAGKSTVAKYLQDSLPKSTMLLNADHEVSLLLGDESVAAKIAKLLGSKVLRMDGLIDRRVVASLIFLDEQAKEALENLLHPEVRRAMYDKLFQFEGLGDASWAILDVPLLFEGGLDVACDFKLFVDVQDKIRCERACTRHGWAASDWKARENAQLPLEQKQAKSDAMVRNEGSIDSLQIQLAPIAEQIMELAPRPLRDRWPA